MVELSKEFVIECIIDLLDGPKVVRIEFRKFRSGFRDQDNEFYKPEEITVHLESGHWKIV
jgi:hypothetical protein